MNLLDFIFKCVIVDCYRHSFAKCQIKKIAGSDFEKDKSIFLSNISEMESKELDIICYNNWVKINI